MRQPTVIVSFGISLLLLGGVVAASAGSGSRSAPPPNPAAQTAKAGWTAADCASCHEKTVNASFEHTKHATLEQSCATCHAGATEHLAGGPAPTLKKTSAKDLNALCLTCHEKANQASYLSSMHARRNVACTSCHSVHASKSDKALLKTKLDSDTCYTCHQRQRALSMRTSHHPVREGKVACSSCHNPHEGVRPAMIKADSTNELCYTCHAEKRGPFLFEHAPVKEDCVTCHEPHGSNHSRLLAQKAPNLCWNCHLTGSGHFGSGDNFSTEKGVQVAPPGAPSGYPTVNSRFIERSCRTCHVKIHGTNHPSGAYFVR